MAEVNHDLFDAAEAGDLNRAKQALASNPSTINQLNEDGATALHLAAMAGHRKMVELLVERGGDLNIRDTEFHATVAGWAIEYLRERGGLLATEIEDMLFAIREGDVRWAQRFLSRHSALRAFRDKDGRTLAEYTDEHGQPETARFLRGESTPA